MVTHPLETTAREPALILDRELSLIGASFDLLLHVTPINADAARARFKSDRSRVEPHFHYRPLNVDVAGLRRRLAALQPGRIDDALVRELFEREARTLEARLGLLEERNTSRFLELSRALYGDVEPALVGVARQLLDAVPALPAAPPGSLIDATAFAHHAEAELAHYRALYPGLTARVELRDDVASLIVARGKLLVPARGRYARNRVRALLEHEIGTHLVTYVNGGAQPLGLLQSGLSGHEELQEGLAVFTEYLAGQLSTERVRLLAARVVAVADMIAGEPFVAVFQRLNEELGLGESSAFMTTMRTFRGGGFTKDAVYLRGLVRLLAYLGGGGSLHDLLVGKLGFDQLPLLPALARAGLVGPPALLPRYLDDPTARARLARARGALTVLDLVTTSE